MTTSPTRPLRRTLTVAFAIGLFVLLWLGATLRSDQPVLYADIVEHFKYGSIGSEPGVSLLRPVGGALPPLAEFAALPSICPDGCPADMRRLASSMRRATICRLGCRAAAAWVSTTSA